MAKFLIKGSSTIYFEEKEIEADTIDDATLAYYMEYKEGTLVAVNDDWNIEKKEIL